LKETETQKVFHTLLDASASTPVKIGKKESPPEPVFPDHDFVNGNDKGNHFLGERIKPDGFVFKKGSLWILIYIECIIKWKARGYTWDQRRWGKQPTRAGNSW